jgi:hypothetical protein
VDEYRRTMALGMPVEITKSVLDDFPPRIKFPEESQSMLKNSVTEFAPP